MRRVFPLVLLLVASLLLAAPLTSHPLERRPVYFPIAIGGAAPTPTGTETPQDLHLAGLVHDAQGGTGMPLAGARVSALLCVPRAFSAVADESGRYALFVPASYAYACGQLTLEVTAPGYATFSQSYDVRELALQPQRDFGLQALATPTITPTDVTRS